MKLISNKELTAFNTKNYDLFYDREFEYILYYENDVFVKGNLDYKWFENELKKINIEYDDEASIIIFNKDLKVEGKIIFDDEFTFMFVNGNLSCEILYSNDEFIIVKGNADIKYAFYGNYNDGSIQIEGKTKVPFIINDEHFCEINSTNAIIINYTDEDNDWFKYDFFKKDLNKYLLNDLCPKHENIQDVPLYKDLDFWVDTERFINLIKQGKSPFKNISDSEFTLDFNREEMIKKIEGK